MKSIKLIRQPIKWTKQISQVNQINQTISATHPNRPNATNQIKSTAARRNKIKARDARGGGGVTYLFLQCQCCVYSCSFCCCLHLWFALLAPHVAPCRSRAFLPWLFLPRRVWASNDSVRSVLVRLTDETNQVIERSQTIQINRTHDPINTMKSTKSIESTNRTNQVN